MDSDEGEEFCDLVPVLVEFLSDKGLLKFK
jgi:hypothetical protein